MHLVRQLKQQLRYERARRAGDRGAVLPLVLVMIVLSALVIGAVMSFAFTVLTANKVEAARTRNVEGAKAGVRVALRDPSAVFNDCDDASNQALAADPAIDGTPVSVSCSEVSDLGANQYFGFAAPVGTTVLQVGPSVANQADFNGLERLSGVVATSGAAPPYTTAGLNPTWAWWQSYLWVNPLDSNDSRVVWQPPLPVVADVARSSSPLAMDAGFNCQVFLPGRYSAAVSITNPTATPLNIYFASGTYYFDQPITISGNVRVIVGQGIADFGVTNACADDIQVAYNLAAEPSAYAIDGGGATWVLGNQSRLIVREASGRAPTIKFNQRYATAGGGGWISLMSVNGDHTLDGTEFQTGGDHYVTNVNSVPRSQVLQGDVYDVANLVEIGEPTTSFYVPSHRDFTDEARLPGSPVVIASQAFRHGSDASNGAIKATFTGVEGQPTNGALVDRYEVAVQVAMGTTPPATFTPSTTCTTTGGAMRLLPTVERSVTESASTPDEYACLITGLTPGSSYWVAARAWNETGWGPWSATSNAAPTRITVPANAPVAAAPTAPTAVTASQVAGEALITWTAPSTNDTPIEGYDVAVYRVYERSCATYADWDDNCDNVCDLAERAIPSDANCDGICDPAEQSQIWDTNCNGICDNDIGEPCDPACVGAAAWDTDCDGVCDVGERSGPWDLDCDSVCDVSEQSSPWDDNCNSVCDADERSDVWDANCNNVCDSGERSAPWDADCDSVCDSGERSAPWDADCDSVCDSGERTQTWDNNCNGSCDQSEGELCISCELWDRDCDGVCEPSDYDRDCDGRCDNNEDNDNPPRCDRDSDDDGYCNFSEPWDLDCDGRCDASEDCISQCVYHDDPCNSEVCEPWDRDCDGVCEPSDYDRDCDGRCDNNEDNDTPKRCDRNSNGDGYCNFTEPWDTNCDGQCDDTGGSREACGRNCAYHNDQCNATCNGSANCPSGNPFVGEMAGSVADITALAEHLAQRDAVKMVRPEFILESELVDGVGCSSDARMDVAVEGNGVEWAPASTQCSIDPATLPDLAPTDSNGDVNVGYRFEVTARSVAGASASATVEAGRVVADYAIGALAAPAEVRVVYPWVPVPIIDIDTAGTGSTVIDVPGYLSVPMGRINVANGANDPVRLYGGVLAGTFVVGSDTRSPIPHGYQEDVILQRTVRITATAGGVTSIATVKINADADSYGIVSWTTQ